MTLQRLTAEQSERDQAHVAGALRARGLAAGDRVAFVCPNSAELVSAVIGASRAGIVPVLVNPALLSGEQQLIIADADPALVVRAPELATLLGGPPVALAPTPLVRPMHYTSGTTGRPKGVWSGVLDERAALAQVDDEAQVWHFAPDDVMLVCSPLHHSAPLRFATGTLLARGQVLVLERFDARQFVHTAVEERPTLSFAVPAHLQRLAP